jgi:hypothetical protein
LIFFKKDIGGTLLSIKCITRDYGHKGPELAGDASIK